MAINKYNGLRKVTISFVAANGARKSSTMMGQLVSSDGLEVEASPIDQSIESFGSTTTQPVGVEIKSGSINLIPLSISDKGKMLPDGYDETSNTWNMFEEACTANDATIAYERVCTDADGLHGVNYLFRHAMISIAHKLTIKRASTQILELHFYPQFSQSSEYGLTGTNATKTQAWQEYYGVYDGATDTVTYDTVKPTGQSLTPTSSK